MDMAPQEEQRGLALADEHTETRPMHRKAALEASETGVLPIMPRNIEEAQRYASGLITANQVPDAFREGGRKDAQANAPLVLMGILKAMEVGLPPQTGLASLLPLNGRFSIWGDGAQALVQNSGVVTNHTAQRVGVGFDPDAPLGEWPNDYGYEVRFWRKGQEEPYIGRFTVRDAKRANLWMNSNRKPWIMYPDRMLFNRARAFALRDGFADCLLGLSIAEEVIDALPPVEPEAKRLADASALDDEPVTEAADAPAEDAAGEEAREAETQ